MACALPSGMAASQYHCGDVGAYDAPWENVPPQIGRNIMTIPVRSEPVEGIFGRVAKGA